MKPFFTVGLLVILAACSSTRETTLSNSTANAAMADNHHQVSFAKMTVDTEEKSALDEMQGTWYVQTMQRHATLSEESLNLYMSLNKNKTFTAATSCGKVKGDYSINGLRITFSDVSYDRGKCENSAQLDEMVRLLTHVVSQYAFNGNMLFLKDNTGNNVFRITR